MHPYQVWPFDYTSLQSVTIAIKGTLWLLLFIMTVISEHNYLVLLKNAFSRVHMMFLWISWSHWYHHLYHTHGCWQKVWLQVPTCWSQALVMAPVRWPTKRESRKLVQQTHHALMTRRWQSTAGLTAPFTPRSTAREKNKWFCAEKCMTKDE